MEAISSRSDRDSNLPEYYEQPPHQQTAYQYTPNRQISYPEHDIPKEPDHSTELGTYTPTAYTHPAPSTAGDEKNSRYRLPFGCSPVTFGVVTALITAIIVGAAVGGGVGGALSRSNSDCKSAATAAPFGAATITTTVFQSVPSTGTLTSNTSPASSTSAGPAADYSALAYTDISTLDLDCPALESQNYSSGWESQLFNLHCDFLYNGGDIASVFVYSWQECVEACASVNHYTAKNGGGSTCLHALFQAGLDDAVTTWHRNCWMKGNGAVVATAPTKSRLLAADLYT